MAEIERSTEDIRQDIAREEENLSRTAQQIGDRIKEKLDWSAYVKDSPYLALGAAAGLGFLASKMLQTPSTPIERIMGSLAEEVREALGGLHVGAARPSLTQMTLLGIATKVATDWIKNKNSSTNSSGGIRPQPQTDRDATNNPEATT
jgi:hypothetical protein